jgi:hypothetical protein
MTQMHTNACEMERESFVLIALSAFVPFCLLTHLFVHSLDKYIKRILYCQSCPRCEQYGWRFKIFIHSFIYSIILLFLWHLGSNSGLCTCQTSVLPLSFTTNPWNNFWNQYFEIEYKRSVLKNLSLLQKISQSFRSSYLLHSLHPRLHNCIAAVFPQRLLPTNTKKKVQ